MYHVGVSNIFELLDDENDEEGRKKVVTNVPSKQVEATQPKQKTPIQTGKEQPRKKDEQITQESSKATTPFHSKGERTEKRPRSGEALEGERKNQNRRPREQRPERPERPERKEKSSSSITNEGPKRDNNKERDNKTPQGQKGAKRVYDRKSGTGRGKEVKKGGGGRRNWGKSEEVWEEKPAEQQEVEENKGDKANKTDAVAAQVEVKQESEEEKKKNEEEEKKRKEEEEKEAKLMTYEDYLKKKENEKGEKTSIIPGLPTLRKPGEGVDQKDLQQWAKFTAIKRDDDLEEEDKPSEGKKRKKEGIQKASCASFL